MFRVVVIKQLKHTTRSYRLGIIVIQFSANVVNIPIFNNSTKLRDVLSSLYIREYAE